MSEPTPPHGARSEDEEAEDRNGDEESRTREPVFPKGRPLTVPADAVQLTFLDPGSLHGFTPAGEEDGEDAALELRTPLGVKIPVFEGPLDLLLHLIRRDRLDIYDIPIGHITEQYLSMLGVMQVLDLEIAGDFLVMAATLMRIKARMLLPTWPEDEEEEDPRAELVRQLLEYRRFKEAAQDLRTREEEVRQRFGRGFLPDVSDGEPVELEPLSHFTLIEVLKDVLARVGEEFFYEVELEDVTLEEKIDLVLAELEENGRALFVDLVSRFPRRIHIVVTFMAILELARLGRIAVAQDANFGQIWIYPATGQDAGAEGAAPADPKEETEPHGTS